MLRIIGLCLMIFTFGSVAHAAEMSVANNDTFIYSKSGGGKPSLEFSSTFVGTDHSGNFRFDRKVLGKSWPANEGATTPEGAFVYDRFTRYTPSAPSKFSRTLGESWTVSFVKETKKDGSTQKDTATCSVAEIGPHAVVAGRFKASKVVCKDGSGTTTTWYDVDTGIMLEEQASDGTRFVLTDARASQLATLPK